MKIIHNYIHLIHKFKGVPHLKTLKISGIKLNHITTNHHQILAHNYLEGANKTMNRFNKFNRRLIRIFTDQPVLEYLNKIKKNHNPNINNYSLKKILLENPLKVKNCYIEMNHPSWKSTFHTLI